MAVLSELQAKYPTFKVKSLPVPGCRSCKGTGERLTKSGLELPCLCVCMSGDDETRTLCTDGLAATAKKLRQEMQQ